MGVQYSTGPSTGPSTDRMRLILVVVLLLVICVTMSQAKKKPKNPKPTKQQRKSIQMFKQLRKRAKTMEKKVKKLQKEIAAAEKLAEVSDRHDFNVDAITVVDAHYTGNQCGPFTLTSWSTNLNIFADAGSTTDSSNPFSSGTFTSPKNCWYHICSFSRFKNSGNSNDVTILQGGSVVAAYGSAVTYDWRSTGICFDTYLSTGTTITVRHQSGGSSDCIQSTGYPYNKFTAHTVACDGT